MIDSYKWREVATIDVPGAYLHVDTPRDKKGILELRVTFVDIIFQINPEHNKNMMYKSGQKVLYMLVLRSIYGCIDFFLQLYKLYSETLMEKGFELSPYYIFVTNKWLMVNNLPFCGMWRTKKCRIWKKN